MMRLEPIGNINFGIYKKTVAKPYGYVDIGQYQNKIIEIYNAKREDGSLLHKLYYIKNKAGEWLMSRLKYFYKGKCNRIINSRNFNSYYVGDKDA